MSATRAKPRKSQSKVARALKSRLENVRRLVRSLSRSPAKITVKNLHDARVACRRSESALQLCKNVLPQKPARELRQLLKKLRRSCNASRDCDVLLEWIETLKVDRDFDAWRELLEDERHLSLPDVTQAAENLADADGLWSVSKRIAEGKSTDAASAALVVARWFRELARFAASWLSGDDSPEELHAQRVAVKRLRYATEFLHDIESRAALEELTATLKDLQGRLGQIQDASVRLERLSSLSSADQRGLKKLRLEAKVGLSRLIREWEAKRRKAHLDDAIASAAAEALRLG